MFLQILKNDVMQIQANGMADFKAGFNFAFEQFLKVNESSFLDSYLHIFFYPQPVHSVHPVYTYADGTSNHHYS